MQTNSKRTAIARKGPSSPTLKYEEVFRGHCSTILDFGCGRGADVRWLQEKGYLVNGYDPAYAPGLPSRAFDAVMLNYVLCVIPNADQRKKVLKEAWKRVKQGGFLCIAVRPEGEIRRAARRGGWKKHADGWLTGSNSFQRGYAYGDLIEILPKQHRLVGAWQNSWCLGMILMKTK
jgi:DNA phosphorothioation-associated putative methyltransferase